MPVAIKNMKRKTAQNNEGENKKELLETNMHHNTYINYTLREYLKRDLLFILWARIWFFASKFAHTRLCIDCVTIVLFLQLFVL